MRQTARSRMYMAGLARIQAGEFLCPYGTCPGSGFCRE